MALDRSNSSNFEQLALKGLSNVNILHELHMSKCLDSWIVIYDCCRVQLKLHFYSTAIPSALLEIKSIAISLAQ